MHPTRTPLDYVEIKIESTARLIDLPDRLIFLADHVPTRVDIARRVQHTHAALRSAVRSSKRRISLLVEYIFETSLATVMHRIKIDCFPFVKSELLELFKNINVGELVGGIGARSAQHRFAVV